VYRYTQVGADGIMGGSHTYVVPGAGGAAAVPAGAVPGSKATRGGGGDGGGGAAQVESSWHIA
jgi:hypothetical protein